MQGEGQSKGGLSLSIWSVSVQGGVLFSARVSARGSLSRTRVIMLGRSKIQQGLIKTAMLTPDKDVQYEA